MNNEKMGKFIAERRKAKGMTQLELANELQITDKAVSKWERGLGSPDIGLLLQLADILGVSVSDLLKGEVTDEPVAKEEVTRALRYAEKSERKKHNIFKFALFLSFSALLFIGMLVCAIVDVAVTNSFSWSLYPISSILFAWCVLVPTIGGGKKGIISSLIVLTVLIFPYLFALDRIVPAEGVLFRVGAVTAIIVLVYLWSIVLIMRRCKNRKLLGAGMVMLLAAPVCVLINVFLVFTLTPEAGVFDVWDVLDIFILAAVGLALIGLDAMKKRRERN